jgi:hypothetical protein
MRISHKKPKECSRCGCDREITLMAKVAIASKQMELTFKRLCVPCLLHTVGLSDDRVKGTFDYQKAMACAPEPA